MEIVVLGLLEVEDAGKSFLVRTGPSFVQPLAGLDPQGPPAGRRRSGPTATRAGTGSSSSARTSASPAGRWPWPRNAAGSPRWSSRSRSSPTRRRRDAHVAEITERVRSLSRGPTCWCTPAAACSATRIRREPGDRPAGVDRGHRGRPRRPRGQAQPGWWPRAELPHTMWRCADWASAAPRCSANCCPGRCRCSNPSNPRRKWSARRMSCSPATLVTKPLSRTSSTSSADEREGGRRMARVGWIGLGAMGLPMAACVARAGHEVVAYDIDPGRAAALAADGVKPAATIAEAAAARGRPGSHGGDRRPGRQRAVRRRRGGHRAQAGRGRHGDGHRRTCRRRGLGGPTGRPAGGGGGRAGVRRRGPRGRR